MTQPAAGAAQAPTASAAPSTAPAAPAASAASPAAETATGGRVLPTQSKHPWRATARTVFAALIGALTLLPEVVAAAHIGTVPTVVQILAVTGAVTRVLALPGVNAWLETYVPWLSATPRQRATT